MPTSRAKVVKDERGESYTIIGAQQPAADRGPARMRHSLSEDFYTSPYEFTLVQVTPRQAANKEYHIIMTHQETNQLSGLSFRDPSTSIRYVPRAGELEPVPRASIQHVLLPALAGPAGQVSTRVRISNGGDTEGYSGPHALYGKITGRETMVTNLVRPQDTWCLSLKFHFDSADLARYWQHDARLLLSDLSERYKLNQENWLDSVQVQIIHGSVAAMLTVAFRFVEERKHNNAYGDPLVRPLIFDIGDVKVSKGVVTQHGVIKMRVDVFLRLPAEE